MPTKATLYKEGEKPVVVEANSQQAQDAFGKGYTLQKPAASLAGTLPAEQPVTELGNFRTALKGALNEAARARTEARFKQLAPYSGTTPGTMGSVVDMIRGSINTPVEQTFSDVFSTFKDVSDQRVKSMDKMRDLAFNQDVLATGKIPAGFADAFPDLVSTWQLAAQTAVEQHKLDIEEQRAKIAATKRSNTGGGGGGGGGKDPLDSILSVEDALKLEHPEWSGKTQREVIGMMNAPKTYTQGEILTMLGNMKSKGLTDEQIRQEVAGDPKVANKSDFIRLVQKNPAEGSGAPFVEAMGDYFTKGQEFKGLAAIGSAIGQPITNLQKKVIGSWKSFFKGTW